MAKDGVALAAGAMINTSITPLERLKATFQMDSPISRIVSVSVSPYGLAWRDLDAASSANVGKGGSDGGALDSVPLFIRQFVAGGVSGGIAKSAVAPLERVKILFQFFAW